MERWKKFQSTLPVWGATAQVWACRGYCELFQSTLPVWGATLPLQKLFQ